MKAHSLLLLVMLVGVAHANGVPADGGAGPEGSQTESGHAQNGGKTANGTPSDLAAGLDDGAPPNGDISWEAYDNWEARIELEQQLAAYYKAVAERRKFQAKARRDQGGKNGQRQDVRLIQVYGAPGNLGALFFSGGQYWHRREGQTIGEGLRVVRIHPNGAVLRKSSGSDLRLGLTSESDLQRASQPQQRPGQIARRLNGQGGGPSRPDN